MPHVGSLVVCEPLRVLVDGPLARLGFVAQDVQKIIPEAVTENSKGYLLVNNDPILWAMLNAIKQQQREIEDGPHRKAFILTRVALEHFE